MPENKKWWVSLLGGWMVPGLGHWLMGKRSKGLFLFSVITATYLFGLWAIGFSHPRFHENPLYYFGRFGSGFMLALSFILSSPAHPIPEMMNWFDIGMLYSSVAGLLNLVVVLNIVTLYLNDADGMLQANPIQIDLAADVKEPGSRQKDGPP